MKCMKYHYNLRCCPLLYIGKTAAKMFNNPDITPSDILACLALVRLKHSAEERDKVLMDPNASDITDRGIGKEKRGIAYHHGGKVRRLMIYINVYNIGVTGKGDANSKLSEIAAVRSLVNEGTSSHIYTV
jgi:hypothetical protein